MKTKTFEYGFMACGLLIQVVTYLVTLHSFTPSLLHSLSFISGCLGVCSVCLSAQGNILNFVFGFAQVGTYTWLCVSQRFYGEIAINAYYFLTMLYGTYAWYKRLKTGPLEQARTVTPRRLAWYRLVWIAVLTLLASWLIGWGLATWTDDTQPYLDAFTTVPALVAQILFILVYREHWFLWLAVDVLSVVLWLRAGDYCMVAQYAFWCANCFYGLYKWHRLEAQEA